MGLRDSSKGISVILVLVLIVVLAAPITLFLFNRADFTPKFSRVGMTRNQIVSAERGEAIVNSFTRDYQINPSIAMDRHGNFVIVWASKQQDGDLYGIFAQRYDVLGQPQGEEFQVNTYTKNNQKDPAISMDDSGNFIIVWESWYQERDDGYEVYGQSYNVNGLPSGGEFRINTTTKSYQKDVAVAMNGQGNFVAVWLSWSDEVGGYLPYGQLFGASGEAVGAEFQVSNLATYIDKVSGVETSKDLELQSEEEHLVVGMDAEGNFAVSWRTFDEEVGSMVVGKRFDGSTGSPLGKEFQVSQYPSEKQELSMDMNSSGQFVVAWQSEGQDGDKIGVFARKYDDSTEPSAEFQVNTYTIDQQGWPSVAISDRGDFIIAYESWYQDGDETGIFAQKFAADGTKLGEEFQVNDYTYSWQEELGVALDNEGNVVITWMSWERDGDADGIAAKYFPAR